MAFELDRYHGYPGIAASNINPRALVAPAAGSQERAVAPVASNNVEPLGIVRATALRTEGVTVYERGAVIQAVAAASLGVGAEVGHASSNSALAPVAGASGVTRFRAGVAHSAAAAGERFSLYVDPKQLSNLI